MQHSESALSASAARPTPILNQPDFDQVFNEKLPLDEQGLLRCVETIALPGTKFKIVESLPKEIVRVMTSDYPGENLFVDRRFLQSQQGTIPERERRLPALGQMQSHLEELIGSAYIWGGNWPQGVPEMLSYYPPKKELSLLEKLSWTMEGIDCSGLLYLVTDGISPRNTSDLIHYGKAVAIAGMSREEILAQLKPLDCLVWKGHVVLVFDQSRTIESRAGKGVIFCDLAERLDEILKSRAPSNNYVSGSFPQFVARRFLSA
jgi:hypothetical protein